MDEQICKLNVHQFGSISRTLIQVQDVRIKREYQASSFLYTCKKNLLWL